MVIKHAGVLIIHVAQLIAQTFSHRSQYDPTEPGDYRVEVKWAGELVPGSPFPVMIFDTEEELRRFMQGGVWDPNHVLQYEPQEIHERTKFFYKYEISQKHADNEIENIELN